MFFDKLTVKPNSSESAAVAIDTPYRNELKIVLSKAGAVFFFSTFGAYANVSVEPSIRRSLVRRRINFDDYLCRFMLWGFRQFN